MRKMLVLGIMSGTSADGVDYALCRVKGQDFQLSQLWSVKYPEGLRERVLKVALGNATSYEMGQLHHDLGRFYAEGARRGLRSRKPDLIGLHGQTVFHNPARKNPATVQLGEPSYLAEATGALVIHNFRAADLAVGGQAAPLATLFHKVIFAEKNSHVCFQNLGGIANVTSMNWRKGKSKPNILAFDTGPANVLIDMAAQYFSNGDLTCDEEGALARRGIPSEKHLKDWLKDPYFSKKPPKSTGRELFGEKYFKRILNQTKSLSQFDVMASLTEFTARSISLNYKKHLPSPPDLVILGGGGAYNPELVKRIKSNLQNWDASIRVTVSEALGWPSLSIEAAAFALLAYYRFKGWPGNIPETTGARKSVLLGQLTEV